MRQDAENGSSAANGDSSFLVGATLVLCVLTAGYLRLDGIGDWGYWTDELFHVFAARSYLDDGDFHIPWQQHEYTRAKLITLITALSFHLFGESEVAARTPFALINILFIVIAYPILKRLFSRNVALIFVIAMTFSSFAIGMSRECRMYTLFQLFYFLMAVSFFRAIEPGKTESVERQGSFLAAQQRGLGVSWLFLLIALAFGAAAISVNTLAVIFVFVVLVYAAVMFGFECHAQNIGAAFRSRYSLAIGTIVLAGFLYLLGSSDFLRGLLGIVGDRPAFKFLNLDSMINLAFNRPVWMTTQQSNLQYYYSVFAESHPFLWAILPIGLFMAVFRYKKAGAFFAVAFITLFLLHSFVFIGRQSDRYVFYAAPFFVTIGAIGAETLFLGVRAIMLAHVKQSKGTTALLYGVIGLSVATLFIFRYPNWDHRIEWFAPRFADWKDLDRPVVEAVQGSHSVTTDRLRFTYYFDQLPDRVIEATDVNYGGGDVMIVVLDDLLSALDQHSEVYVVTHENHFYNDAFVGPDLREFMAREMERVDDGQDELRIMIFRKSDTTPKSAAG